ncbi:MAG TPA: TIR domain-containing protein [Thermoanaerobaculia bacterium]|nr:TIR domain-containing protein [Thermoanaerobaculia bacterium]
MAALQHLKRQIFGEDIFVSYSRSDGMDYALTVAAGLKGLVCYLDQLDTQPGEQIPHRVLRRLESSTVLVLLATPAAASSTAVAQEVKTFLKTSRPIIPVSVGGALENSDLWPLLKGAAISQVVPDESGTLTPTAQLLQRISSSFIYTRRAQWLRRIAIGTVVGVVGLLALAAVVSWRSIETAIAKADALVAEARETARTTVAAAEEEARRTRDRANYESFLRHEAEAKKGKR